MPLGDLLPRTVDHLVPMVLCRPRRSRSHFQTAYNLVLSDPVPIEHEELQTYVHQAFIVRHVKQEGLVEHWIQGTLLHVRLLLGDTLAVVQ